MRAMRARNLGRCFNFKVPSATLLALLLCAPPSCFSQTDSPKTSRPTAQRNDARTVSDFEGSPVRGITFTGVSVDRLAPLPDHLAQKVDEPLNLKDLAESLRQVFATGLFETVEIEGVSEGDGVNLIFNGVPREFVGTVSVYGARGSSVNSQLEQASRLLPGTRFRKNSLDGARTQMMQTLADNGYHEATISQTLTPDAKEQLVNISFEVDSGPQARVGDVQVTGDSGMTVDTFRRAAKLQAGSRVDNDTVNRALNGVLRHYQKRNLLEAEIKLVSQTYDPATKKVSYHFTANRGPVVRVSLEGASMSGERLKRAIPVYEEGTVDEDLLNEGSRRLRDYYQRLGYFDVKVEHKQQTPSSNEVVIVYTVTLGLRRRVTSVTVSGNKYFDSSTLKDLLSVHEADTLDRHGTYSQALVAGDVSALQAVYQNNGFSAVSITPSVNAVDNDPGKQRYRSARTSAGLEIDYHIDEGEQQRVGSVVLQGNNNIDKAQLTALLNTSPGQLFSPLNLAGDRDALLTSYLNQGFEQVKVDVEQKPEPTDANLIDIAFHISEGEQTFVRGVHLTGLHYTRPDTVARAISLRPGDALSQAGLLDTQRNLYDFALFNEVNTAIENPNGAASRKTVLVQVSEARRWTFTYGIGFEAQTGTPQNNCSSFNVPGVPCSPNGKTGISPRVLGDLTRNNLFGREQSASIQGTYGLLEQRLNLVFQNPHFRGNPNFGLDFTGGYANSLAVTTYVASKLDANLRWTERFNTPGSRLSRANTFVYEFSFRRVKVAESSLQVFPAAIPILSEAVRVAGPGLTWIRDTRDSPIDAHRGSYISFQNFLSGHAFGSQAQFNRLDTTYSSYYAFDKNRLVLARNTRYAQMRAYGVDSGRLIPLPERIYAGGPTSLRGFSINAAGPRDPETGFPIGGAGAVVNSFELRLPPPMLPWVGDSVSFVLFHDMGNVFTNAGDAWASALRVRQPNRDACKQPIPQTDPPAIPSGPVTSTGPQGACSFDYFSHDVGLGLRYHTPVGPIRFDFSYGLNPPIYPVTYDYSNPARQPYVGQSGHFNFFFSLGQTF